MPGTPPPVGVIGVIHFDIGTVEHAGEIPISELVNNPEVIAGVRAVQSAETSQARVDAIGQLLEALE